MREENSKLLGLFLSGRVVASSTAEGYGYSLRSWDQATGQPLEDAGAGDVDEWFRAVNAGGLAPGSIMGYGAKLRKILEYVYRRRGAGRRAAGLRAAVTFDRVPWEDLLRSMSRNDLGLDMLMSEAELGALVRAAVHPRPRALIPVTYESGCRKGELIGARVRDLQLGPEYAELRVLGKTGLRVLPLVRSVPALEAWLQVHPDPRPAAPLFPTVEGGRVRWMNEGSPNQLMIDLCRRAGLRHLHPHQLRHTRLTELAAAGVGEYVLKSFAGWAPNSRMAARYIHLSGRAHMRDVLRTEGVDVRDLGTMGPAASAEVPGMLARVLQEVRAQ